MGADGMTRRRDLAQLIAVAACGLAALLWLAAEMGAQWPEPWPQPWPQPAERVESPRPLTPSAQAYAAAYARHQAGEAMIVVLTAKWCGPCQRVKRQVPRLERLGAVALLDVDEEPDLARQQLGLPPHEVYRIPTLVHYLPGGPARVYGPAQIENLVASIR